MKREIKIRVWDMSHNKMASPENVFNLTGNISDCILSQGSDRIVMQYTGLKDKNGKEIYEGDVLKVDEHFVVGGGKWTEQITIVSFEIGRFVHRNNKGFFSELCNNIGQFEVIGNIYEPLNY